MPYCLTKEIGAQLALSILSQHADECVRSIPFVIVVHFRDGTSSDTVYSRGQVPSKWDVLTLQIAGRSISCKVIEVRLIEQPETPNYAMVETQEI